MDVMKEGKRSCELDASSGMLKCIDPDGTVVFYRMESVPSDRSLEIKHSMIDDLVNKGRKCFDDGTCSPIHATFFSIESCPHCTDHALILDNVQHIFKKAGIPFQLTKKNAREHLTEFKALKCNGTPCVAIDRDGTQEKLYEGNKGEIGTMADLLGLPNPLFETRGGK